MLRLSATDIYGQVSTDDHKISVVGNLKLGEFNLSFTDMTIPVGGIPLTVTRSYDTLNAGKDSDFSYGWQLKIADPQLEVYVPQNAAPPFLYPAMPEGTRIYVTIPGGQREGFTFYFRPEMPPDWYGQIVYMHPEFQPDPGVTDRLSVPDVNITLTGDQYEGHSQLGLDTYTPDNPIVGGNFTLTTPQGLTYGIDANTHKLISMGDRNGDSLTFTDTAIISNRGPQVTLDRDFNGHITKITDPAGNAVLYGYDDAGNLTSFTDRLGNVTHFVYRTDVPHYLDHVVDPLGRTAASTVYGPDGRIQSVTDASGKTIQYNWNTGSLVQHVTDQLGNTTEIDEDALGNVIRQVSPDGVITLNQYADPNNPSLVTSETTVVGQVDTPQNGEHNDLTTKHTYDAMGNETSTTSPDGTTTRTFFDVYGDPTSEVDAAGNATTISFDSSGNLTQVNAPTGDVTQFAYSGGDLTQAYNTAGQLIGDNTYDVAGHILSTTPVAGRQTFKGYDADGNQVATWYFDGAGAGQVQILDLTFYDQAGQATGAQHLQLPQGQFITANFPGTPLTGSNVLWTTGTTYDIDGKVVTSTNDHGLITQNTYDQRGELIQVRQQAVGAGGILVWLDTRTVFDAAGHEIAVTSQYPEGTTSPIQGTLTTYDGDGKVAQTQQVSGMVISITGSGASLSSVLTNPGTQVTTTSTAFDSAGRQDSSTDQNGLITQTICGTDGNVIQTRRQSVDQNSNVVWLDTETVYDAQGRVMLTTDEHVEGSSAPIYATMTQYDDLGREVRSIRLVGVQVSIANGASTLTNSGTQLWSTQTIYDDQGRVSRSIAADGQITDYGYDTLGRKTAAIGTPIPLADAGLTPQDVGLASGTGVMVRLRSETVYNALGQVQTQETNIRELVLPGSIQIDRSAEEDTGFQYDPSGNVIRTTYADGTTTGSSYDAFGNKISDTNQLGQTKTYQYDADGRLISVTLPAVLNPATGQMQQPIYTYAYDANGNQTLIQDPLDRQTTFTFDGQGNELSRTLPLGFTETFQYDSQNRKVLHVSFEGVVTQYVYDPLTGQLGEEKFFSSLAAYNNGQGTPQEVWSFLYDALGRQVQVIQAPAGDMPSFTQSAYDGEGRVTSITSAEGVITCQYDNLGRKTATIVGTPANQLRTTTYTYDALSRLKTVVDTAYTGTTTYRFDLMGNVREEDMPNGVIVVSTFGSTNHLTSMTDYGPSGSKLCRSELWSHLLPN